MVRQVWRHSRLLSRVWMWFWDAYLAVWVPLARVWMWAFHRQWLREYDAGQEMGVLTRTLGPEYWENTEALWADGEMVCVYDSSVVSACNYKE